MGEWQDTKENSFMLAIPKHEEELRNVRLIMDRIRNSPYFTVINMGLTEEEIPVHEIMYHGDTYKFFLYPEKFEIPEMFRVAHFFSDVDVEEIEKRNMGLTIEMEFSDKILESYHLQLKIIDTIFPDTIGVLDFSAEKIISGAWVGLAAKCNTPPAPRYLFTTQAVYASDEDVWLHTHGLNRCGLMELEILGSTKETAQRHCQVIESVAARLLDDPEIFQEQGAIYVAKLSNNQPLVATWIPWQEAMDTIEEETVGGPQDRTEESGHGGYTGCLFVFDSPESMDEGRISHISIYDELLEDNPMYMMTNSETDRMRSLAMERVGYMREGFEKGAQAVLIKVGLTIDEEYRTETNMKEHIWFELKSVEETSFTAELTQEPYMVSGIHAGDVGTYSYDEITDWIVFTESDRITPDEVYLMDM